MGPLATLYVDDHLLAVDKPPGRLVIPGRGPPELTVQDEAQRAYGRLWVVHRLDRGTSGVLLFARSAEVHRLLNLAFDRREVEKHYLAIVKGAPAPETVFSAPIAPARRGRMRPGRPGDLRAKPAVTRVKTLELFDADPPRPALALVEAIPETGRTHQIRVHLAWAGFPLAVDQDYGDEGPLTGAQGELLLDRTPLHAVSLALAHPIHRRPLRLEAPWPEDMAHTIAVARRMSEPLVR